MQNAILQQEIKDKIEEASFFADAVPGVTILHSSIDGSVVWMSKRGLNQLDITLEEISKLNSKEYHDKYFNPDDAMDYAPKILDLLIRNNDDECVSFFQQVRINGMEEWTWHMSSTRIFLRDKDNQPHLLITISFPIDPNHAMTQKASRLLDENNFLRENIHEFAKLTKREIEVLKYLAKGITASACGEELFISPQTVETHRKNIKKKLGAKSFHDLHKYAKSFDLI